MKCRFCEAELPEGVTLCPECEQENTAEEKQPEQNAPKAEKKEKAANPITWQTVVALVAAAVLLCALAVVLLVGMGVEIFPKKETTPSTDPNTSGETPAYVSDVDYTGTEEEVKKAADTVVAAIGDAKLTNAELQLYYNIEVSNFISNNASYLSYMGLDYTKPLNEQQSYYDESKSWEVYFLESAVDTWHEYQAMNLLAAEAGYALDSELQAELDRMPADLEEIAKEQGFATTDELIKERIGATCTAEDYLEYYRLFYYCIGFTSQEPAAAEVEKYFNDNAAAFSESGITKESGAIVDVRHILIGLEGGTKDEEGNVTYSDAEWAACKAEAEKIYKQWKKGKATEETFAELANEYSVDDGSNQIGGLYTGITSETSFVEPFLTWCMDAKRKVGETGLVKTEFGYHIMYLSSTEPQWKYYAREELMNQRTLEQVDQSLEKWPIDVDYSKVCILEMELS